MFDFPVFMIDARVYRNLTRQLNAETAWLCYNEGQMLSHRIKVAVL